MALAIGSFVIQRVCASSDGAEIGLYGQITSGVNDAWNVLWFGGHGKAGALSLALDNDLLTELELPFQATVLRRRVIPSRSCSPAMAGTVLLQDANNRLIVESALGTWFGQVTNVREI
jgi:hypothetical protein